jgi:hypothetical protein
MAVTLIISFWRMIYVIVSNAYAVSGSQFPQVLWGRLIRFIRSLNIRRIDNVCRCDKEEYTRR